MLAKMAGPMIAEISRCTYRGYFFFFGWTSMHPEVLKRWETRIRLVSQATRVPNGPFRETGPPLRIRKYQIAMPRMIFLIM
jgi:hypothetical protein